MMNVHTLRQVYAIVHKWRLEDNLGEFDPSFLHVGSGDLNSDIRAC